MYDIITKFAANNLTGGGANKNGNQIGQTVNKVSESNSLWEDIKNIINAVIAVLGIVCVIVIIIGGINYMTSSGDAGKVKKAKDTILYGVIGLVICVLAFAIVNFVISTILSQ